MKTLTTRLYDRAMADREMPADPLAAYRASAADQLGQPVIDAALFTRQHSEIADTVTQSTWFGGLLSQLALKKVEQARAGGLPEHFLLAVTENDVIALERKITMSARDGIGEVRDEVARWRRADLEISVKDRGHKLHVTLRSPSEDETVKCSVVKVDATAAFVALLGMPVPA